METPIWGMLETMGIAVEYANLPPDRDGEYIHARKLIRLQHGMASRLHRSVLAHECAHAVFADVPTMFGPVNRKQERRADEWAAMRLINPTAYRFAEQLHQGHVEAMAVEVGVTVDLVEAFQRVLLLVGDTVYIDPHMGAGQYLHREQIA